MRRKPIVLKSSSVRMNNMVMVAFAIESDSVYFPMTNKVIK